MAVNTIVGQVATGKYFFKRTEIIDSFWKTIVSGSNVLISAPRRVGKTSLMYYFKDHPKKNYRVIYIITESVNNKNEYYKKIFNAIFDTLKGIKKFSRNIAALIKSKTITSITKDGISFDNKKLNYYDELIKLIRELDLGQDKMIIMIDEFSQTIENIIEDENKRNAINILQSSRKLRQMPEINKKIQFVYAGSIGLENTVSRLNAMNTINDLFSLKVPPLSSVQAKKLVKKILNGSELIIKKDEINYLLGKIEWLIPFHIQLILNEIDKVKTDTVSASITNEIINRAFEQALEHRNYFEHWHTRLRKAFKQENYNFTKELLNYISEYNRIDSKKIFDMAVKHKIEENYKDIVNVLVYDGYINNNNDIKIYSYNSPLLKLWWNKNVAK